MQDLVKLSPKVGLHGRPGALLVELSLKNPKTKIFLEKNGKRAEADSVLSLLALGAGKGEEVGVRVVGENEAEVFRQVKSILQGTKK